MVSPRRNATVSSLLLILLCLTTAACGGDDEDLPNVAQPGPSSLDLASAPLGETRTVHGTVTDALSGNSFAMVDVLVSGEPLLVISPDPVPLRTGYRVTVTGSIQEFQDDSVSRFSLDGADLPPVEEGDRFMLAETVDAPVAGTDGS